MHYTMSYFLLYHNSLFQSLKRHFFASLLSLDVSACFRIFHRYEFLQWYPYFEIKFRNKLPSCLRLFDFQVVVATVMANIYCLLVRQQNRRKKKVSFYSQNSLDFSTPYSTIWTHEFEESEDKLENKSKCCRNCFFWIKKHQSVCSTNYSCEKV